VNGFDSLGAKQAGVTSRNDKSRTSSTRKLPQSRQIQMIEMIVAD
jgi:hypothetical protein